MDIRILVMLFVVVNVSFLESKSIRETRREKSNKRGARRGGAKVWTPNGISEDTWKRCRGLSCDKWEERQLKLMKLNTFYPKTEKNKNKVFEFPEMIGHEGIQSLDLDGVDGCIWLTSEQIDDIIDEDRSKKADTWALLDKWEMPINYFFDGRHSRYEKNMVREGVKHWEEHTCVRFKEINRHDNYPASHLVFTADNTGCHSWIGKMHSIPQQINLQSACFSRFGTVVHEIGHALGLWHEQQRTDRDFHVKINYDNMGPWFSQFAKKYTESLGVEYDIGSVMHYGSMDGSINGGSVIEALDPLYQGNMGQRSSLSFNDAKIINVAYCTGICKVKLQKSCKRGGYQDPNNCGQCRCPPGFGGKYCDAVAKSKSKCGGTVHLHSDSYTYIESPSYNNGKGSYEDKTECNWLIKAPYNYKISLTFEDKFAVFCKNMKCDHWVEVKYKGKLDKQGPRFCCYKKPNVNLVSEFDEMVIIFRSEQHTMFSYDRIGFRIKLHLIDPNGNSGHPNPVPQPTTTTTSTTTTTTTTRPTTTRRTTSTTTTQSTTTTAAVMNSQLECIKVDLSFLLDSSGSVQQHNWIKILNFLSKLITRITISEQCTKIGIISFGNDAEVNIPLNYAQSTYKMIADIKNIKFKNEWTNTAAALDLLVSSMYKTEHGARASVANVTFLFTDGNANKGGNPVDSAKNVRNNKIHILGVGATQWVDKRELEVIANGIENVHYIDNFAKVETEEFIQEIIKRIKKAISAPILNPDIDEISSTSQSTTSSKLSTTSSKLSTTSSKLSTTTTSSTAKATTTLRPWATPATYFNFECSFESRSLCNMMQHTDDEFDWTVHKGKTPSDPTGPNYAYDGEYYIYIEASSTNSLPRKNGDKARISLPAVPTHHNYCVTFWYHMYGFHIKSLTVYRLNKYNRLKQLWKKSGEKGDRWIEASLNTKLVAGEKIVFEGERGNAYSGDIAVDKIKLKQC